MGYLDQNTIGFFLIASRNIWFWHTKLKVYHNIEVLCQMHMFDINMGIWWYSLEIYMLFPITLASVGLRWWFNCEFLIFNFFFLIMGSDLDGGF